MTPQCKFYYERRRKLQINIIKNIIKPLPVLKVIQEVEEMPPPVLLEKVEIQHFQLILVLEQAVKVVVAIGKSC
jgi:hypothetical protein